jgi:hypothetical protein
MTIFRGQGIILEIGKPAGNAGISLGRDAVCPTLSFVPAGVIRRRQVNHG